MTFADAFWPQMLATAAGVILTVPGALWLDRRSRTKAEAAAKNDRTATSNIALMAVASALAYNSATIALARTQLADSTVPVFLDLRTRIWAVALPLMVTADADALLILDLSSYFEDVDFLERGVEKLREVAWLEDEQEREITAELAPALIEDCDRLVAISTGLSRRLDALKLQDVVFPFNRLAQSDLD